MIKKISLTVISLFVICLVIGVVFTAGNDSEKLDGVDIDFSEKVLSEDQLFNESDLIVTGKIVKQKNAKQELIESDVKDTADIYWTYSTYVLKVKELLSGDIKSKEIEIIFAGSDMPTDIIKNKDYLFFLEKDMIEGAYHLKSYVAGVYEAKDDSYINKKLHKEFKKDAVLEKIKTK